MALTSRGSPLSCAQRGWESCHSHALGSQLPTARENPSNTMRMLLMPCDASATQPEPPSACSDTLLLQKHSLGCTGPGLGMTDPQSPASKPLAELTPPMKSLCSLQPNARPRANTGQVCQDTGEVLHCSSKCRGGTAGSTKLSRCQVKTQSALSYFSSIFHIHMTHSKVSLERWLMF